MAYPFFDAVKSGVSGTPGTGTITMGTVVTGFRAFSNVPASSTLDYRIDDGTAWEIGNGMWNGTTLTRGLKYSSTGSLLSLSSAAVVSLIISADDIQPHIGSGKWAMVSAVPGSATPSTFGCTATANGTASSATVGLGSFVGRQHRVTCTSAAAASSNTGFTMSSAPVGISTTGFAGGFEFIGRFGITTYSTTTSRFLAGVSTSSMASTNPSAMFDLAVIGFDAADTTFSFISNDASGTATKTSTGVAIATAGFYEAKIWANPGERKLQWTFSRIDNGTGAAGVVTDTAAIPTNDTAIGAMINLNTGTATTAVVMTFQSMYVRSSF
jgi:hypothetical protein